jgi:hypothetical protein
MKTEDLKCPKCGKQDSFRIQAQIVIRVMRWVPGTGLPGNMIRTTANETHAEWDEESVCLCDDCDFTGVVKDFKTGKE